MNRTTKLTCAAALLIFVAGCAGGGQPAPVVDLSGPAPPPEPQAASTGDAPPATGDEPGEATVIPLDQGGSVAPASPTQPAVTAESPPQPANPAVVALLNDANRATQNGRPDRAAASIERALTIEPQNAWLWHRLARIRMAQGELGQAAALAAKSTGLAGDDRGLKAANWRLIADVHRQRGESSAARSAEANAARLETP